MSFLHWLLDLLSVKSVYFIIALATAYHTAYGAAYVMTGPQPVDSSALLGWWLQGIAYAIAIDVTMFKLSDGIRTNKQRSAVQVGRFRVQFSWYVITFAVVVLLSAYFQLVYGYLHTQALPLNTGVSEYWQAALNPLLDARIVIVPLALPAIAVLYALGGGMNKAASKKDVQPRTAYKPPEQPVQVSKPEPGQLPAPKSLVAQRVYEHLELFPQDINLSSRQMAEKLEISNGSAHAAMKQYKAEKGIGA